MKIITAKITGITVIDEDTQLNGMIVGKTTVSGGATLELNGMVVGNLTVDKDSTVHLLGMVVGNVINNGGRLDVWGTITGAVFRNSGSTSIASRALILNKTK